MEQRDTYWSAACTGAIELPAYHTCKVVADAFQLAAVRCCQLNLYRAVQSQRRKPVQGRLAAIRVLLDEESAPAAEAQEVCEGAQEGSDGSDDGFALGGLAGMAVHAALAIAEVLGEKGALGSLATAIVGKEVHMLSLALLSDCVAATSPACLQAGRLNGKLLATGLCTSSDLWSAWDLETTAPLQALAVSYDMYGHSTAAIEFSLHVCPAPPCSCILASRGSEEPPACS